MVYTQSSISSYLYGIHTEWEMIGGKLNITNTKIEKHKFQNMTIKSGFFYLPGAENVSAILFSNAGTIAKFDRMGILAGYKPDGFRYWRQGYRFNPDPNAVMGVPFLEEIGAEGYDEGWADELQVRSIVPLPMDCFGPLTQHVFDGENIVTTYSGVAQVLTSVTITAEASHKHSKLRNFDSTIWAKSGACRRWRRGFS